MKSDTSLFDLQGPEPFYGCRDLKSTRPCVISDRPFAKGGYFIQAMRINYLFQYLNNFRNSCISIDDPLFTA